MAPPRFRAGRRLGLVTKQYVDGALVAFSTSAALAVPSAGSSLRLGWNGAPAHASSSDLFAGSVSDLRLYCRALLASEMLALSQPPLVYAGAANPAPSLTASYTWTQCASGFSGVAAQSWTKDAASNTWSLAGAGINCTLTVCGPAPTVTAARSPARPARPRPFSSHPRRAATLSWPQASATRVWALRCRALRPRAWRALPLLQPPQASPTPQTSSAPPRVRLRSI